MQEEEEEEEEEVLYRRLYKEPQARCFPLALRVKFRFICIRIYVRVNLTTVLTVGQYAKLADPLDRLFVLQPVP